MKRTANGMEHHGIHRIPSVEFEMERPHLMSYRGVPTIPSPKLLPHHVRKDNVITYKGKTGTYQGHRTQVYLEEKEEMLYIYSLETGKNIAVHKICKDKGQLISNTSHRRDREAALDDYEATVRKRLPGNTVIDTYLSELRIHKNRNYRDNLQFILLRYLFHEKASLIITTNKAPTEWAKTLDDEVLASAILDRLLYHCEVIKLSGQSYRMGNRKSIFDNDKE